MIKSILKIIIGVFNYYILSFLIYTLFMYIELWRIFIQTLIIPLLFFFFFLIDKTFVLIFLLVFKKNRHLLFNKSFIILQTLFGCMNLNVGSYIADLLNTDSNLYMDFSIYEIMNIIFIILYSYIYNKGKINSANPLKNVFYLLFNMNDKKLRIKDYTYINVVMSLIVYVFLMILLNVIAIYCANCGIKKI